SIGPWQHLQMARMRALENGRWLLRGTNNGVTAIVDHRGGVVAQLPQFTADVLTGSYQRMQGRTPYSRYGDWPLLTLLALGLLFSAWRRYARSG
ncbi:MAG: apolipoprotein N-acyltransferase, partial [Gammaproteobacteria bacterium]|nr:apolipoprotein N-acyltransferase [Gammaproteobacteria bacterium]